MMLGRASTPVSQSRPPAREARELIARFRETRARTERLCAPLALEDFNVQSMPDASPAKWHLAHTTWFFEQFILLPHFHGYKEFHRQYGQLFNSYYDSIGPHLDRAQRGLLSRPTVEQIYRYRTHVEENLLDLLARLPSQGGTEALQLLELGIHHEQQHQELLLTDLLNAFAANPLHPAYRPELAAPEHPGHDSHDLRWVALEGGLVQIGSDASAFAYDNETPRHAQYLIPYELGSRLVTNAEFLEFIGDGGYSNPLLWLSAGWDHARRGHWEAPLYWEKQGRAWWRMTLRGMRPVAPDEPVCHVSYFEADAYARWKGARLPSEGEWENAASNVAVEGNFAESEIFLPRPAAPSVGGHALQQLYGDVWEWTASPYAAYPGFRAPPGALGEYNAKFMCNQMVLRGGSCASPASHLRASYRNYFAPEARWQFSGFRLAR